MIFLGILCLLPLPREYIEVYLARIQTDSLLINRLAEMSFGLCCVSMPALSKMLAHHQPPYEKLKSWVSQRYNSVRSNIGKSSLRQPLKMGNLLRMNKTDSRSHDVYLDLEHNKDANLQSDTAHPQHELGPLNSVRTLIGTGRSNRVDDSAIHYEVDLQQNVHSHARSN